MNKISIPLEYINCDKCGSIDNSILYRKRSCFRDMFFSICKCSECGLVFVNPRLPEYLVGEVYSDAYYEGQGIDAHFKGEEPAKAKDAELLVRCLEQIVSRPQMRLLDVGGGAGLVTDAASRRGHEAEFSDLSVAAVSLAKAKGLKAHLAKPEELAVDLKGQFDVVVALEVIEHVYSPRSFLTAIHGLLKPGGVFVFTTGNVGEARWRGASWGYFNIPEAHLYYFSTSSMNSYLAEAGFSGRISPYDFYFKQWWAVRLLEKIGAVDLGVECRPKGVFQKGFMQGAKLLEGLAGRARFHWAVK